MSVESLIPVLVVLPIGGFVVTALIGRRLGKSAHWIPVLVIFGAWVIAMVLAFQTLSGGAPLLAGSEDAHGYAMQWFRWIPADQFVVDVGFLVDPLTACLLIVVTTIGLLVHVYSVGYMSHDPGYWRFFAYLNLFMFSMLLLVLADSWLVVFVAWELVGLCSYLLIGFWYRKRSAALAAKKAFIVNRVGDVGFALGIMLIFASLGTPNIREVIERIGELDSTTIVAISLLIFAGAMGKSAQFPLHVWLPDAMEGPTPVSALIHAATMVNAGVYMVARANPIFAESPAAMWVVASIGVFTAIFAAAIALTQNDIKKVLAYSTVSQLAYMFFALGIGAWVAAIFHLVSHGFFKGLLFMGSGSVIHGAAGEQDMRFLGGLRERMTWTYRTMVVGSLALAGIPIFAGFFSKDEILGEAFGRGYYLFWTVGLLVAFMTAFYTFRMVYMTFHGTWRGPRDAWQHVHESAPTIVAPLIILAVPTILAGLFLGLPPEGGLIHGWLEEVFHGAEELGAGILPGSIAAAGHEAFGLWPGAVLLLLGASVGAAGIWLAYRWYVLDPEAPARFVARIPLGLGPGMYAASVNKYYVDDLYGLVWARGGVVLGNALWWFDAKVIDGAVNGAGWLAQRYGALLRRSQTGHVQNYALGMAAGLVVVLVAFLVFRS